MMDKNKISTSKIADVIGLLEEFRQIKNTFNVNEMLTFFAVSLYDDPSVAEVSKRLGIPPMSVSRHALNLSSGTKRTKTSGVGLIERYEDPNNRLLTRLRLTEKGRDLLSKIASRGS